MSRWGRVGLLCALMLVLLPSAAWAIVDTPTPDEAIPFNAQPITLTGSGLPDGSQVEVFIDGEVGDFCAGTVAAVGGEWTCTLPLTVNLAPGLQRFEILEEGGEPFESERHVEIGDSALAITTAELTSTTTLEVHGVRDATGSSGVPYNVQATILLPFSDNAHVTVPCESVGLDQYTCTYEFEIEHPPGTLTEVEITEIWAEKTVYELPPVELEIPGTVIPPVVDPPVVDPPADDPDVGSQASVAAVPGVPIPLATTAPPAPSPTEPAPAPTPTPETPEVDPPSSPSDQEGDDALRLLLLAAIAFAILAMIGPHGLAYASDQVRRQRERGTESDGVHLLPDGSSADQTDDSSMAVVLAALAARDRGKDRGEGTTHARKYGISWGDRSWTWQFAGWKQVDQASRHTPMNVARRFPLIARIGADANYLRAVFGTLWLLLPLAGIGLGVLAADNAGGLPVAPSVAITATLVVFAILDATSGAVALLAFTAMVLLRGDLSTLGAFNNLRGLLGLAALWFAIPLIAAAARPFRRLSQPEHVYRWDRLGDGVIAALVGGLAVYATCAGFSDLVNRPVAISHHAGALALLAATAILMRVAIEELITVGYPARLRAVQHTHPLSEPSRPHRLRGIVVQGLVVALFASAVIGNCWQLWVGVALCVIPQILSLVEDRLPNITELHRKLPRGIVEFFIILSLGLILARLIADTYDDDRTMALRDGFLLLATPLFFLTTLGILGRTSPAPPWTWPRQIAGAMFVVATLLVALIVF